MSSDDANGSSSGAAGIAGLKGVTLLGSQSGQSSIGSADRYYIQRRSGKVFGPFDKGLIRQMIEGGKLSGHEGVSQDKQVWLPILSIPDFADLFDDDQLKMTPRGVPILGTGADEEGLDEGSPFGPSTRVTRPGMPKPLEPEAATAPISPNIHEEPTRAFSDSSVDAAVAPDSDLPSLNDLPMPGSASFEMSNIPGLEDDAHPFLPAVDDGLGTQAPTIPELPPPPSYSASDDISATLDELPDLEPPSSAVDDFGDLDDLDDLFADEPAAAPELPTPKSPVRPSLRPRPSFDRDPSRARATAQGEPGGAELPMPKSALEPELPAPKSRDLPPLGGASGAEGGPLGEASEGESGAELPVPKAWSLPELPMPKDPGAAAVGSGPELPTPKGAGQRGGGMPELPMPKSALEPELPVPKGALGPELPVPKSASGPELPTPKTGQLPELPMPQSAKHPELPRPRRGQHPELPLPKTGAELPTLADGFDLFGGNKLPELPTPKFEDVHLPGLQDDDEGRINVDDLLGDFGDTVQNSVSGGFSGGFLLDSSTPSPVGDTFSGLDDDLLPPPTGDFDATADLLGDFDAGRAGVGPPRDARFAPPADDAVADQVDPIAALGLDAAPAAATAAERPKGRRAKAKRTSRARRVPTSRVVLLVALLVVMAAAGLYLAGVFDTAPAGPDLPGTTARTDSQGAGSQEVVVAPTRDVELARLRPGNFGDYVGFLQPAGAAAASAASDRDAQARLLVGQALMAAQYGEGAVETDDMGLRADQLADSTEPLHRLARGAVAAVNGDVDAARDALGGIDSGEHAAMAQLFLGIAEVERYERAVAARSEVELTPESEAAEAGEPGEHEAEGDAAADADTAEQAAEADGRPGDAAPDADDAGAQAAAGRLDRGPADLGPAAVARFEQAVRLDPGLVPAHYFLGVSHRIAGDADAARAAFEAALDVQERHYPSLLALSELLIEQGDLEGAGRHLVLLTDEGEGVGSDREQSTVHELLGRVAEIQRDDDRAAQELERAFTTDPSNDRALAELSELLLHSGQHERAIAFLEEHAPNRDAADVVAALSRHRLGRSDALEGTEREELLTGLVAELERARGDAPHDPRFPYLLGQVRLQQNLFDEAEALFEASIEADDQYRPAWVARAELARLSNEMTDALGYLQRAESVGRPDSALDTAIGDAYQRLNRPASALAAYRRAVEVDPLNMQARLELARFEIDRGDRRSLNRALEQLEVAEGAGVDDAELHALFAEVHYGLGHLNQARERMNRVADADHAVSDPTYVYLLGRINFDAGQLAAAAGQDDEAAEHYATAEENFNTAWVEGFESPDVRYWEARAMLVQDEIDRAVLLLRRAIDQALRDDAPHGAYQYWLGYAYEALGQHQQALESYAVVDRDDLRWALGHPELYYRRGRLFARSRLFRRAKRDLEWSLILQPNNAGAAYELAEVHAMERDYDRALDLWLRSLVIDPDQPRVHYRLGMSYLRMENGQEAMRHLELARDDGYGDVEPGLYRTLGFLYKDARRDREAVRELVRYLETGTVPEGSAEQIEIHRTIERLGGRY